MRINVQIEQKDLILQLEKGQRRLAYAVVIAINNTAKRIQQAEFEHIRRRFQVRQPKFLFGSPGRPGGAAARIRPFASVKAARPYADIQISAPPGRGSIDRRLLLPHFEHGGLREPFTPGASYLAVPVTGGPARPTFASKIPKEFTFAGMRLTAHRGRKKLKRPGRRARRQDKTLFGTEGTYRLPEAGLRGKIQWKGRHRTFIIFEEDEHQMGGVYQRIGPRAEDITPVWVFRKPMRLRRRIRWMLVARRIAATWFPEEMERQTVKAVAHARGRSA